jgi:hypothetical protein
MSDGVKDAMMEEREEGDRAVGDIVIQLPIDLLKRIADSNPDALLRLDHEWSAVYLETSDTDEHSAGILRVSAFDTVEDIENWLAEGYDEGVDVKAVLNKGKRKKFNISVNAKISKR